MGCPQSKDGVVQDNEIDVAVLLVKATFLGSDGGIAGMTVIAPVGGPVPSTFVAETLTW